MAKLIKFRKPRLRLTSKGLSITRPGARVGGAVGVNISSKGVRPSIHRSKLGIPSGRHRKGCGLMAITIFILIIALSIIGCTAQAPVTVEVTRLVEKTVVVTQLITTTPGPTQTANIIIITVTSSPTPENTPTNTNSPEPTNTAEPTFTPAPTQDKTKTDKGPGFYLVGSDIAAGVWRNNGNTDGCYWAVTSKTGDILDNHFGMGGGTMYVNSAGFQVEMSEECGTWIYLGE